jgi:zinc transport system ATP-binding protein
MHMTSTIHAINAIRARNISFSYDGLPVLKGISFEIGEGDFVAVIGPNGAGKTTLVKLITGLLPMQKGAIEIFGTPVQKTTGSNIIGYVPQRYTVDSLFPGTVREILATQKTGKTNIHSILGIHSLLAKKFTELSGGQQQRVLIALALQSDPRILILDEPTVGVDVRTEQEFLRLLKHINREHNITILLITHDVGMIPAVAGKVLCLSHNIFCMGPASKTKELLKQVYGPYEQYDHHGEHHA